MKDVIKRLMEECRGVLPAYSHVGGYPIYYIDEWDNILCNECATKEVEVIVNFSHNFEDPHMYCDRCSERIESAYAEEDE